LKKAPHKAGAGNGAGVLSLGIDHLGRAAPDLFRYAVGNGEMMKRGLFNPAARSEAPGR